MKIRFSGSDIIKTINSNKIILKNLGIDKSCIENSFVLISNIYFYIKKKILIVLNYDIENIIIPESLI